MCWVKSLLGGFLVLLLAAGALGCTLQEGSFIPLSALSSHVGEIVRVRGCLFFSCPTLPWAVYPRDCIVLLQQNDQAVPLKFPPGTEALREMLNDLYEAHFARCIRLEVLGKVVEVPCEIPECVPAIFLEVEDIAILEEQ